MRNVLLAFTFTLMLTSMDVFASDNTFCTPLVNSSQNKEIVLPGPTEANQVKIYFFKNKTTQSIWIDHPVDRPSASAGWSSYLRKGNASALLVNRKNFAISCAVIKPGKVDYLNCEKSISVCVANNATMTAPRKGTYWLVEDKVWDDVLKALEKRGVLVNKSSQGTPSNRP